jgi:histidine triad (HIT) family protein
MSEPFASDDCPHCDPRQTSEAFAESEHCFAIWAYEPPEGGVLICPRAHRSTVFDLTTDEWNETQALLVRVRAAIDDRSAPDGYNVGWNVLPTGGQRVPHAHLHVVPRWSDEPHAGKGIRWWIKQPDNRRPSS